MANRMIMGRRNDGTFGLDISKAGVNVLTATTNDQYLFTSKWVAAGVVHQIGTVSQGSSVYFPALPYVPAVAVWAVQTNGQQGGKIVERGFYFEEFSLGNGQTDSEPHYQSYKGPVVEAFSDHINCINISPYLGSTFNFTRYNFEVKYAILRIKGDS